MKNTKFILIAISILALILLTFKAVSANHESQLIDNLNQGKPQTIVTYGTSLTEVGPWVGQLRIALEAKYPNLVNLINSGKAGMWSTWGVDNLDERVIEKRPDTVFIEFAINDAHVANHITLAQAKANLENMISRIHKVNRHVEIILMTMNPPVGESLEKRPDMEAYYQMYRDVAKKYKLTLIDHEKQWQRILKTDTALFKQYVPDGLHPGTTGCEQVITPGILKAIGM